MKNILVPTDFSLFAEMAFDAAILMAKKMGSKIYLYHKADLPIGWEEWEESKKNTDKKNKNKEELIVNKLDSLVEQGRKDNIQVKRAYSTGNLISCLKEILIEHQIDLIVMGSHGVSGKEEFFIGSNAQKAIRKLHVPILVVKSPVPENGFSRVLFASGLSKSDEEPFRRFIDFVRPFKPEEIHVMAVDTTSYFTQPTVIMKEALKSFEALAGSLNCRTHFHRDFSIEAGIRHLSEDLDVDLVGISNRARRPLKRMFQGSNVELLVNHSNIPVLAIDYSQ